jgi:hypothetical protein
MNVRDPGKISPFGRNDNIRFFAGLAGLARKYSVNPRFRLR